MPEATEITHICIDNSRWMRNMGRPTAKFTAQLEAIELYCETKFECNRNHLVGLSVMSSDQNETLLSPTNDIQQIRRSLKGIRCSGEADFESVFMKIAGDLLSKPPNMGNSLLLFVGSRILIGSGVVSDYGDLLKKNGIAVNVVNLFVLEGDLSMLTGLRGYGLMYGEYHYGREELGILFVAANNDGNSHIVDVKDPSSVCEMLSNSILKKDLLYLKKKNQKNAEENVNVKQQLELSHKESVNVKAPRIQSFKSWSNVTMRRIKVLQMMKLFNHRKLNSTQQKRLPLSSGRSCSKNQKRKLMLKQEAELSCDEKNQANIPPCDRYEARRE